ncbi:MAG: chemotaxis response regulator protein-glutamate methylesterase [Pseudomonadota bacterium]
MIRVLVVDDSALMRGLLTRMIDEDERLSVVGAASDAYQARRMIKALDPDVLTLDIDMPGMNGLAFLRNLMRLRPMPVVMVSALAARGASHTLTALELGAFDVVEKPRGDIESIAEQAEEIRTKLCAAAQANIDAIVQVHESREAPAKASNRSPDRAIELVAIGASTGGTEAIRYLLDRINDRPPPIVISQHLPVAYTESFAARLNATSSLRVKVAEDATPLVSGEVLIAPGDRHLEVERRDGLLCCALSDGAKVNRHRPSVDVLFRSVARCSAGRAAGLILTGMGKDGAQGLKLMRDTGAATFAQDRSTSVVWGMPNAALTVGGVEHVLSLARLGDFLCAL